MRILLSVLLLVGLVGCAPALLKKQTDHVVWNIDNLDSIGGHETTVIGSPGVIETPKGKAVEFDGLDDALLVANHPLAGAGTFTAEVIFRPDKYGWDRQRFFHMQENESQDCVLFVASLTEDAHWFLNTYIRKADEHYNLEDEELTHPVGEWYHAALVVDASRMRQYVNGVEELSGEIPFTPQGEGQTSIGVRFNQIQWFKGAVRKARFTPRVLSPGEFLRP